MAIDLNKKKASKALSKIDMEIQDLKEFSGAKKIMGDANVAEHCLKTDMELADHYTRNIVHIKETERKVEENSEYKKAKLIISDFNTALRSQLKPYKTVNSLTASILLHRKRSGELDSRVAESWAEFESSLPTGKEIGVSDK
jgi:hypothetical protein